MAEFGTTADQLGAIAVALRAHANGHPDAVMHAKALTLEQYLARPMLVDPPAYGGLLPDLRRRRGLSDDHAGACARSREAIGERPRPGRGRVGQRHLFQPAARFYPQRRRSSPRLRPSPWRGSTPRTSTSSRSTDPFTIVALMQIEDMGFCAKGEGGAFVAGDRLSHRRGRAAGGIPLNTHGGLLSHAYLLGIAHVVELVRQLRGEAHNQVADARIAAYGGFTGGDASTLLLGRA